jgi:hypothetical protein
MWARTIRYGRAIRYARRNAHTRKRDLKFGDDLEIGLNKPMGRTAGGCDFRRLRPISDPPDLPIRPDPRVDSDLIDDEFEF